VNIHKRLLLSLAAALGLAARDTTLETVVSHCCAPSRARTPRGTTGSRTVPLRIARTTVLHAWVPRGVPRCHRRAALVRRV